MSVITTQLDLFVDVSFAGRCKFIMLQYEKYKNLMGKTQAYKSAVLLFVKLLEVH